MTPHAHWLCFFSTIILPLGRTPSSQDPLLVSCRCCNKRSPFGGLKQQDFFPLPDLETGSRKSAFPGLKSRCPRGHALCRGSRESSIPVSGSFWCRQHSLASPSLPALPLRSPCLLLFCWVSPSASLIQTLGFAFGSRSADPE